jgi:ethanolamine utilization microcompartment shell protein EutS
MDEQKPDGRDPLINFIAETVEAMRGDMAAMQADIAIMRGDMAAMQGEQATMRGDMATMQGDIAIMRGDMAALQGELVALQGDVAIIRSDMVTKSGLRVEVGRLETRMDAGTAAVRGDIERVDLRLDAIDRATSLRTSTIQAEVSRLRSVVYLLVKNQPDLLRLLGTEPPVS